MNLTPEQLEAKAAECRLARTVSFETSDTDGFMSQWASGVMAEKYELEAKLARAGGVHEFPALFNLAGERVRAKLILVDDRYKHGKKLVWMVLEAGTNRAAEWVTPLAFEHNGEESVPNKRSAARLEKLGYRQGVELAPARVELAGSTAACVRAYAVRADAGYPEAKGGRA